MELEAVGDSVAGWDYTGYDVGLGARCWARIVPDPDGTIGITYRWETIDGMRISDGRVTWPEISAQMQAIELGDHGRGLARAIAKAVEHAEGR